MQADMLGVQRIPEAKNGKILPPNIGNMQRTILPSKPQLSSRTLVDTRIVDHLDLVGAPPVGAAPITS